jgi:predicted phage replisome organizer
MENGEKYLLFYLKLLVESLDHSGNLRFSDTVPYNDKMLSAITGTDIDIVRTAVNVFSELGMMEKQDDGTLFMAQVLVMTGNETEWAGKKREYRKGLETDIVRTESDKRLELRVKSIELREKKEEEEPFFSDPVSNISEPRQAGCTRIESAKESWNYLSLTPFRYSAFQIRPDDMTEIMRTLSVYDDAAIKQAIQNYGEISRTKSLELKPAYPSGFIGFMKSGVDKYTDEAKPHERCKKPQMAMTPQEKHDAGVAEAKAGAERIRQREILEAKRKQNGHAD